MSTSPTSAPVPGARTGAAEQLHACHASTKCSEANTSSGRLSANAMPGPFVPVDSSRQFAPGQKLISATRSAVRGLPPRESIHPAASK